MLKHSVIPNFYPAISFTLFYLLLIVVFPLLGLIRTASEISFIEFIEILTDSRILASFYVTISCSLYAALFNTVIGFVLAWVLVKYDFYGKDFIDSLVDLPFALPTAIAGIALATLYAENGILGSFFMFFGIRIGFTQLGIIVALIFVGIPFVVRTVEPIIRDFDEEVIEAAESLGANKFQVFFKVYVPLLAPAVLTGFSLSFARGLGEYGSVIFIAGNMPFISEIVPLIIHIKLEQYDYKAAATIATLMLIISFVMLLFINYIQRFINKHNNLEL